MPLHHDVLVQVLFFVQLPLCAYVGIRTARRTGRSAVDWAAAGVACSVLFPPAGLLVAATAYFVCPPAARPAPSGSRDD
jgi:hypothetical protein